MVIRSQTDVRSIRLRTLYPRYTRVLYSFVTYTVRTKRGKTNKNDESF